MTDWSAGPIRSERRSSVRPPFMMVRSSWVQTMDTCTPSDRPGDLSGQYSRRLSRWLPPLLLIALLCALTSSKAQTLINGRRSLVLEGKVAQLVVDLGGGSFTDFHLRSQGLSPLQWGATDRST